MTSVNQAAREFSAASGNFSLILKDGETTAPVTREGIENFGGYDFVRWTDILRVDVYEKKAVFILKSPNPCECGANSLQYNLECTVCNGWGLQPGKRIVLKNLGTDTTFVDWYVDFEGLLQFWARQSNMKARLPDGTPVYKLDIPRVIFKCHSKKDLSNNSTAYGERISSRLVEISRNIAYHDEYNIERLKIELRKNGMENVIPLLPDFKTKYLHDPEEIEA